jgi:hypothetical protein
MAKPIQSDQIKAGQCAYLTGKSISDNPHAPGTSDWGRWYYGWSKAKSEAERNG